VRSEWNDRTGSLEVMSCGGQKQSFAPLKDRKRTRPERYRPIQGMIGTAEIAFMGEPSSTRLLIAT
jgi:hypothetical protein